MLAGRRERRVIEAGDRHLENRLLRTLAVLRVVERELDRVHLGCDQQPACRGVQPGEAGRLAEREVQLGDEPIGAQSPDAVGEADVEVADADEIEERRLRVGRADDVFCGNLLTVPEFDAGHREAIRSGVDEDAGHAGPRANGRPGGRRRRMQRLDESGWPICLPALAVQHHENRPVRRSGSHLRAYEPVPAQRRLQRLVAEALVHQVASGQRCDTHEFVHVCLAEAPEVQAEVRERQNLAEAVVPDPRDGLAPERFERRCEAPHHPVEFAIGAVIGRIDPGHRVPLDGDVLTARTEADQAGRAGKRLGAMTGKVEVPGYRCREVRGDVRRARRETRMELVLRSEAARDIHRFEHEHALARSCEVSRANEPVVARPDDDRVVAIQCPTSA